MKEQIFCKAISFFSQKEIVIEKINLNEISKFLFFSTFASYYLKK